MALIRQIETAQDLEQVRALFGEYASTLDVDLGFQDFTTELAQLPGAYSPPRGRLLLARVGDDAAGCVGVRPLAGSICEMKRLYVRPAFRGQGLGHALIEAVLVEARQVGYLTMRLDTLPTMQLAQELYRGLGFREIPAY